MSLLSSTGFDRLRINDVLPLVDAIDLIASGAVLSIAGRAEALAQLPAGNWIGGTTPYVMTAGGGAVLDFGHVFVTDLSGLGTARVAAYAAHELEKIGEDAPDNGLSLAIIPFQSESHEVFARDAADYPYAFLRPTFGWIAGFDLAEPGIGARVYAGAGGEGLADAVAVLHLELAGGQVAHVELVNLFEADDIDTIRFAGTSFEPARAIVNGVEQDFAAYVRARGLEAGALPLVGDFAGAPLNASIQAVGDHHVKLYAPVFAGVDYQFARPVADYAAAFEDRLSRVPVGGTLFSCNCILNYVFGELEGKAIGGFGGPITFGEIAYHLLNQTLIEVRAV